MDYLIVFIVGTVFGIGLTAWRVNTAQIKADNRRYNAQWSAEDRQAVTAELAVTVSKAGVYKRNWKRAEQTARNQVELLMAQARRPIAMPAVEGPRHLTRRRRPYAAFRYGASAA